MDDDHPTDFMRPAPHQNPDELNTQEGKIVEDPLARDTWDLWTETARKNREIFTEIFRPVPSNLVRDWASYDVSDFFSLGSVFPVPCLFPVPGRVGL